MKNYTRKDLDEYLKNDWILDLMKKHDEGGEEREIRTNQWLFDMDNKRMIYSDVYGDILRGECIGKRVLDVGGGYNALTKILAANCDYYLLDYMAHGGNEFYSERFEKYGINWIDEDWNDVEAAKYDIVIANDIFPDVDQRLEMFIDKYLPVCSELRVVVTYYNTPKFYTTKRVDDSELLTFLSYDGKITSMLLSKYEDRMVNTSKDELIEMRNFRDTIYRNGRQVSYVGFYGNK